MKLLIDENLPKALKHCLPDHELLTVRDMGWQGKKNGELLALMLAAGFDALITFDKNLKYQQNFDKYPIAVLVLNAWSNSMSLLEPLLPALHGALNKPLTAGAVIISESL